MSRTFSVRWCRCAPMILKSVGLMRLHVDKLAPFLARGEHHNTINQCEECVILAHTHVQTRVVHCATLTFQDIACPAARTTKNLNTKSFAF